MVSLKLFPATVTEISLGKVLGPAMRALLFLPRHFGSADHAEPSLYRQIRITLTAFVDDHNLVPTVGAKTTIVRDVSMALSAFHGESSSAWRTALVERFLKDSGKHHSQTCPQADRTRPQEEDPINQQAERPQRTPATAIPFPLARP